MRSPPRAVLLGLCLVAPVLSPAVLADAVVVSPVGAWRQRGLAWSGEVAFLFGGLQHEPSTGVHTTAEVAAYTPRGGYSVLNMTLPSPRAQVAGVWDPRPSGACPAGCGYIFGGMGRGPDDLLDEVVRFDPAGARLEVVAHLPTPRSQAAAAWAGDRAFVLGGRGADGPLAEALVFDPVTATFAPPLALPKAVAEAAAVWDPRVHPACPQGCAYLLGGRAADGPLVDTVRVEPRSGQAIRVVPDLPEPPFAGTAAAWSGRDILLLGGGNTVVRMDPVAQTVTATRAPAPDAGFAKTAGFWDRRHDPEDGCPGGCFYVLGHSGGPAELVRHNPLVPSAPHLQVQPGTGLGRIIVTWTPDHEDDIVRYQLFRRAGPEGERVLLVETDRNSTGYVDTVEPLPWPSWTYDVVALNPQGASPASEPACGVPPPWHYVPRWFRSVLAAVAQSTACDNPGEAPAIVEGLGDLLTRLARYLG